MDHAPLLLAGSSLIALAIVAATLLYGWQGWLSLRLREIDYRRGAPDTGLALGGTAASRIEIADLRERIRKLEAIAAGVDL